MYILRRALFVSFIISVHIRIINSIYSLLLILFDFMNNRLSCFSIILSFLISFNLVAQDVLPPLIPWDGKSQSLVVDSKNPWITPVEKSDFRFSPSYQETMQWLEKLSNENGLLKMETIGVSENGRDIKMVIATTEKDFSAQALARSKKPLMLIQAGIHSGEIDGKDAGMMLLRDITKGDKKELLNEVNLLFVPILNVDGHERSSAYNRINQRGPEMMGWRTNARNLNLNRDYTKLETKSIQAIVEVINNYDPDLYLDIHVTDGVDYQYDITFGFNGAHGYSPAISGWLNNIFSPPVYSALEQMDHIPGPLIFTVNDRDFTEGYLVLDSSPRFSDGYGNARHLPTILVENHSLKPFKQRVLGTYVFLTATIEAVGKNAKSLKAAIEADKQQHREVIPLTFSLADSPEDTLLLKGIASKSVVSDLTGDTIVQWLGEPTLEKIPVIEYKKPAISVRRPKGYWIPAAYPEIIEKLRMHGIEMEILSEAKTVEVEMYRIKNSQLAEKAFEGRVLVSGNPIIEDHQEEYAVGSAFVSTDQPLGTLAVILLEPNHPDSFFQWGYFLEIFARTEYAEAYFMEPYARQMLKEDPALKEEFESKMKSDLSFRENPDEILSWFYERTPYYDSKYLLYPVGRVK